MDDADLFVRCAFKHSNRWAGRDGGSGVSVSDNSTHPAFSAQCHFLLVAELESALDRARRLQVKQQQAADVERKATAARFRLDSTLLRQELRGAEAEAREAYDRQLMDFRRDELVLNEESDGDDDCDSVDSDCNKAPKDKNIQGVEDAYDLVEKIEDKMIMIGNVVRGMDKRMSYNLRLMGSIIMPSQE